VRRVLAPNPGIFTGPGTNTYLVGHGDDVTVIDPGPADEVQTEAILAAAEADASRIRTILVTHTHLDHSPGSVALAERTGADVRGFGPMSERAFESVDDGFAPDSLVVDGETISRSDHTLRAIHTPGHASNHLCFWLEEDRALFSGDHVMSGSTVVVAPLDGDMTAYLDGLRRLEREDPRTILPGHGQVLADPASTLAAYLAHRAAREEKVARALQALGPASIEALVEVAYAEVDAEHRRIARYSAWAILRKLLAEGRAHSDDPDTIESVWAWLRPASDGRQTAS
jgi:glyoxylase-like metal-dependent hydrolase (beta-lactamase superfamily II)